ncbi:MAG: hypothetical protein WBD20_14285, partial [Pirellulaceae bacterium]
QQMVNNGIKYLEGLKQAGANEGEQILLAYTHFKVEHDADAGLVKVGIAAAQRVARQAGEGKYETFKANYEVAISVMLLAAVSPEKYRSELELMQRFIFQVQQPYGGFTYKGEKKGDISQTQYALLAIWTLDRAGLQLDYQRVVTSLGWLLRTQDVGGAWPYLAVDPGVGKPLLNQQKVYMSMAIAGGSSALIAGDVLRLWGETNNDDDPGIVGLPKAIKIYKEDANVDRRSRVKVSKEPLFRAINNLEGWRSKNPYKRGGGHDWYYYQMYTLERYESFVEIANGRPKDSSPAWYNAGVDELRKLQDGSGGWTDKSESSPAVSTAFAILFLIRSTQKAIFTMGEGGAIGGQGFSDDVSQAKLVGGKAQTKKPAQAVTDMLDLLDGEDGEIDIRAMADAMELPTAEPKDPQYAEVMKERASSLDRLERMVRGSRQWQSRRVAAIVLGKSDEIRVVPSLIYALSDPDKSVKRYARDGLRMISRKFEGYGLSDDPEDSEVENIQKEWRDWYRTMDPGYIFLDEDL